MYEFSIDVHGENDDNGNGNGNERESGDSTGFNILVDSAQLRNRLADRLPVFNYRTKLNNNTENKLDLTDTYLVTSYAGASNKKPKSSNVDKLLKNSSLKVGLEKEHSLPLLNDKIKKIMRKREREKTKGEDWFNLPATEVTEEIKNDLEILQMRSVLDNKRFYKKNNIKNISKYFQVGTVVEGAADFYSGRIVKSKRKKTMVEELLADAECKNYQKRKYKEIMDVNRWKKGLRNHSKGNNKKRSSTKKTQMSSKAKSQSMNLSSQN